ncbi:hypothetical protein [Nonomuraea zeae]|uniref:Uncharacterized protein n=1 Tax=Nonomuraea zeae TaxID=1642303 RepID=A0A5S4H174_9ACTN|nr:hypothetical protein [Nonomuraea zeae]TMR38444.1 hypothetical protein ETD85_04905 [Nonomuraea zeae]
MGLVPVAGVPAAGEVAGSVPAADASANASLPVGPLTGRDGAVLGATGVGFVPAASDDAARCGPLSG